MCTAANPLRPQRRPKARSEVRVAGERRVLCYPAPAGGATASGIGATLGAGWQARTTVQGGKGIIKVWNAEAAWQDRAYRPAVGDDHGNDVPVDTEHTRHDHRDDRLQLSAVSGHSDCDALHTTVAVYRVPDGKTRMELSHTSRQSGHLGAGLDMISAAQLAHTQ